MKKLTITISDEAHAELLKLQLEKRLRQKTKTSLAEVAAEALHKYLVTQKQTPTT